MMNKKFGFTLAEVLITLAIIGLVAALTLPTLMTNQKKKETSTKLKKFYSTMTEAVRLSEIDNGPIELWEKAPADLQDDQGESDYSGQADACWNWWKKYLAPYVRHTNAEKGFYDKDNPKEYYETKVYFSDGSTMKLHNGSGIDLIYDVNGDKAPNKAGIDIFYFLAKSSLPAAKNLIGNRSFGVIYQDSFDRKTAKEYCQNNGYFCSGLLFHDDWEFKRDYPYKL